MAIPIITANSGPIVHTSTAAQTLLFQIPVPSGRTTTIFGMVVTAQNAASPQDVWSYTRKIVVYRNDAGAPLAVIDPTPDIYAPTGLAYTVTLTPNGEYVDVFVTGSDGHEVDWSGWVEKVEMTTGVVNTFVPTDNPNVRIWHRADTLATVASWGNLADVALEAAIVQAIAGMQPVLLPTGLGGRPAFDFDGVDDHFQIAAFAGPLPQPNTIYSVIEPDIFPATDRLWIDGGIAITRAVSQERVGEISLFAGNTASTVGAPLGANVRHVVTSRFDTATSEIDVDGVSEAMAGTNAGAQDWDGLTVGARFLDIAGNWFAFDGKVAEVIGVDGLVTNGSAADLQILRYLGARYGIVVP